MATSLKVPGAFGIEAPSSMTGLNVLLEASGKLGSLRPASSAISSSETVSRTSSYNWSTGNPAISSGTSVVMELCRMTERVFGDELLLGVMLLILSLGMGNLVVTL